MLCELSLATSTVGAPSSSRRKVSSSFKVSRFIFGVDDTLMHSYTGSFNDLHSVNEALKGVYGAWVNTDSFAHGEEHEMYLGMRIFELAKELKTVRHYVWSSIDFYYKVCSDVLLVCLPSTHELTERRV